MWLEYLKRNRLRILSYHSISADRNDRLAIEPDLFAAQMQFLAAEELEVISLERACQQLKSDEPLSRAVVLTFDDGYQDFREAAMPVLKQYRFPATLFVVTGMRQAEWRGKGNGNAKRLLSRKDLQEIKADGFSLGSHTVTHADLTTLDETRLESELADSRAAILELGEAFVPFAYPGGTFTERERNAVERAGYDCAVIVGGRWGNGPETNRYLLKREPMLGSDSLDWFKKRVNGFYEVHYLAARARGFGTR